MVRLNSSVCGVVVLSLATLVAGCHSSSRDAHESTATSAAERATVHDRELLYERATTPEELARLTRTDLEERSPDRAAAGLEAFVFTNMFEEHATYASEVYRSAKPALLFQRFGGQSRIATVTALGEMLNNSAQRELDRVHAALRLGDDEALRRYRTAERAVLSPDTLALTPRLVPHANLIDGVLAYRAFESSPTPGGAAPVIAPLARAIEAFAQTRDEEPHFVALVLTAQAYELAGNHAAAIETWLRAGESAYWPRAHRDLRLAIESRIESHTAAVRAEVERAVQADWETRVAALKLTAKAEADAARVRIATLEIELSTARKQFDNLALQLETERFESERQRERAEVAARINLLESQLEESRRTLAAVLDGSAHSKVTAAPASIGPTGSVLLTWQATSN